MKAVLQTDVNLILQIIIVAILVLGYLYRKNYKKHGAIMGAATGLEIVTLILFMGPVFIPAYPYFFSNINMIANAFLINILAGSSALVLAAGLLVAWAIHFSNIAPFYKRKGKRVMDATIILWIISFGFGVFGYMLAYG
jgi:hypothetical protein